VRHISALECLGPVCARDVSLVTPHPRRAALRTCPGAEFRPLVLDVTPQIESFVMGDNGKGLEEALTDEAKGVALEVYKDAAKPAIAKAGQTIALLLEVGLAPADIIFGAAKAGLDRLKAAIRQKLVQVPPDRLLAAPPTIAAPSALHYVLLGEGAESSELREMFENLLVASMDQDTTSQAHPAFVTMISQLTQDEAWILKSISRRRYAAYNLFTATPEGAIKANSPHGFRSLLGIELGIKQPRLQYSIFNLDRLGIFAN